MQLNLYINAERGRAVRLAREIKVNPVMVSQWAAGVKAVPIERCVLIERATGGCVSRWDLRPVDWHAIWPELVDVEGAPAVALPAVEDRHAA